MQFIRSIFTVSIFLVLLSENVGAQQDSAHSDSKIPDGPIVCYFQDEEFPVYKGDSLFKFMHGCMLYPQIAKDAGVTGTVYLSFIITESGEVIDVKVLRGIGYGCNEEAIRVIKLTNGHWIPGKQNGKPIKVFYNLPIKFSLV